MLVNARDLVVGSVRPEIFISNAVLTFFFALHGGGRVCNVGEWCEFRGIISPVAYAGTMCSEVDYDGGKILKHGGNIVIIEIFKCPNNKYKTPTNQTPLLFCLSLILAILILSSVIFFLSNSCPSPLIYLFYIKHF